MKEVRDIMGMPVRLEIVSPGVTPDVYEDVFSRLREIDAAFSTYKEDSEISRLNRGELTRKQVGSDVQEVFRLAEVTEKETNGYFSITTPDGVCDPSGLVKGWAIQQACDLLNERGYTDYYIEIAGDIQTRGNNAEGTPWSIGIKNPRAPQEIIKVLYPRGRGVATSGTYERGQHIYNPHTGSAPEGLASLTIIAPTIYDADRYATAAYAMGLERGLYFIAGLAGVEAYAVTPNSIAHMTPGFEYFTHI